MLTEVEVREKLERDLEYLRSSILAVYHSWGQRGLRGFDQNHLKRAVAWVEWIQKGLPFSEVLLPTIRAVMVNYVDVLIELERMQGAPQEKFVLTREELSWMAGRENQRRCLIDLVEDIKQRRLNSPD